jgi:hypothetical protein
LWDERARCFSEPTASSLAFGPVLPEKDAISWRD